ncbi:MAG: zinc ABC transporter permease AztB [Actinomycetota bacterium]
MDWIVEPFSQQFMQRALLAGILAVIATSLIGTWVVLRGLSFMGDALAHGVLPGIAIAFLLGIELTFGAIAGALVMILGISVVHRKAGLREDTGIGLLFVGMLALGVIVISRAPSFTGALAGFLFGDTLAVDATDLIVEGVAALVTLAGAVVFYRPFLALSFNEEKAEVLGLRPRVAHAVMLTLLTAAIVASFRAVGTLLVFGLLVAPPATASLLARRVPQMMITAVVLGVLSVVGGLLISWHAGTAAGATMAGLSVAVFFLVLAARGFLRSRPVRQLQPSS